MSCVPGVVAAFTEDQAERLTHVSRKQLRYWDKTGFFVPSIGSENRQLPYSRLYSFRDLVSLKVLNALRNEANVSLHHLREVKDKLSHLGDDLWAKTVLYVLNKRVIFHNPEADAREEVVSGQAILEIPLRIVSSGVEDAIDMLRNRDQGQFGKIEKHKNVAHNAAVVAGTRIPVRSIKAFSKAGYSADQIQKEYPTLTLQDIEAALKYSEVA
ncbi:DUF433 domain-containing protein [Acidocella facilis]|uniref:DUF433 domain-containing protein n=1 Tax=Acidocella facilis TaxID=525 RepID=UPI0009DEE2BC|nr:DUF433 domain-containing protein [Acidocella facilis]